MCEFWNSVIRITNYLHSKLQPHTWSKELSEAEHIQKAFEDMEYFCTVTTLDATLYGSPCDRTRLCFIAVNGLTNKDGYATYLIKTLMIGMRCAQGDPSQFIGVDTFSLTMAASRFGLPLRDAVKSSDQPKSKAARSEPTYKETASEEISRIPKYHSCSNLVI